MKGFVVISTQELEVLAVLNGGMQKFPPFKSGGAKCFTLSWGVGGGGEARAKSLDSGFSHFVASPTPLVINDQPLTKV